MSAPPTLTAILVGGPRDGFADTVDGTQLPVLVIPAWCWDCRRMHLHDPADLPATDEAAVYRLDTLDLGRDEVRYRHVDLDAEVDLLLEAAAEDAAAVTNMRSIRDRG